MKIIILGAKGNLGSQFQVYLGDDHEIFAFDKADFDVLDNSALRQAIVDIKPDIVVNCVAYNLVDQAESQEFYKIALALNRDLPAQLAMLALEYNFLLVHYSTDYVFSGTDEKSVFSENNTPNPINKYGESKFLGEVEIQKLAPKGLAYYIVRTSKLFGPRLENSTAKPSFFDIMISLASTKNELTVVSEELSCFTYTPDLAAASSRLMIARPVFGIYHIVNENAATWYEAATELFHQLKKEIVIRPIRSENLARVARRPKYSILQNNKLKKMRPYQDALKDYLKNI